MSDNAITASDDSFERNEATFRMEPPPRWFTDEQLRSMIASMVPVSVEADEDPAQVTAQVHDRLFPRHLCGNQG